MAKVSVIIPNYNHASFLVQRIESVLKQSLQDLEVIILDDASTDDSRNVIESYRSNPMVRQIIYNDTNSGSTFHQWQKGISLSKGQYIWIAESDDMADKYFLEKLLNTVEWKEDTALAFCDSVILENDRAIDSSRNWSYVYDAGNLLCETGKFNGKQFCEKYLINHCIISNVSSVLFSAAHLKKYSFSNSLDFCEDWLMYLTLLHNADFIYLHEPLNYFRRHELTVRATKMHLLRKESLKVLQKAAYIFNRENLSLKQLKKAYAEWTFKDAWWASTYHVNYGTIKNYWKNFKLVDLSSFFKIVYRRLRA